MSDGRREPAAWSESRNLFIEDNFMADSTDTTTPDNSNPVGSLLGAVTALAPTATQILQAVNGTPPSAAKPGSAPSVAVPAVPLTSKPWFKWVAISAGV